MRVKVLTLFAIIATLTTTCMYATRTTPVASITGCYKSEIEKICLLNEKYTQSNNSNEETNSGLLRKFKYIMPEGEFTAAVLYNYLPTCEECKKKVLREVEIQPQRNIISGTHFYISEKISGVKNGSLYKKIIEDQ